MKQTSNSCLVEIAKPAGKYKPEFHQFALQVHAKAKPTQVLVNGKEMTAGWIYNEDAKVVTIQTKQDNTTASSVELRW